MTAGRMLVNGQPGDTVSANDRGFQYGDGLFETIAVRAGAPLLWERHLARLQRGARRLRLELPEAAVITEEAARLCRGSEHAVLKVIVTRGPGARGYRAPDDPRPTRVMHVGEWPYPLGVADAGAAVRICDTRLSSQPALAGLKHLNRLEQVLARTEWGDDFAEGLMLDFAGHVVDGTQSNVFAVIGDVLYTPDLSQCGVAGILREMLLERAAVLGIGCRVEPLPLDRLCNASEIFLTNSLFGVRPVTRLEQRTYAIGEITQILKKDLGRADATV
jgi:4-amino-4-deoxychorismate lyase